MRSNLLKFETSKLVKDNQFRFIFLCIFSYLLYKFLVIEAPVDISFAGWCNSNTTDSVIIVMLTGIVTSTIFTSDYTYRTYKNFLPYLNKANVFVSKILVNLIGAFLALAFWYVIVFILSGFITKSIDFTAVRPLIFRFITQYSLVIFHAGFVLIAGVITKNRALANSFTILAWLIYSFIPFKGQFFFDFIVSKYNWGNIPDLTLCMSLFAIFSLACLGSYFIFNRQEVIT